MYGEKIHQIVLYGSHARGEATPDSDVDILVAVDDRLDPFEVRRSLGDVLYDITLHKNELVSVIVVPASFFTGYNSPFMMNVRDEGVIA